MNDNTCSVSIGFGVHKPKSNVIAVNRIAEEIRSKISSNSIFCIQSESYNKIIYF